MAQFSVLGSHETMAAFLKHFDEHYNGVHEYLKHYVGLSDEDIETIRNNLLIDDPSAP